MYKSYAINWSVLLPPAALAFLNLFPGKWKFVNEHVTDAWCLCFVFFMKLVLPTLINSRDSKSAEYCATDISYTADWWVCPAVVLNETWLRNIGVLKCKVILTGALTNRSAKNPFILRSLVDNKLLGGYSSRKEVSVLTVVPENLRTFIIFEYFFQSDHYLEY